MMDKEKSLFHYLKRVAAIVAMCVIVSGLSACNTITMNGSDGENSSAGTSGSAVKIAFVSQIEGIPYFNGFKDGAEQEAKKLGVTYRQVGPAKTDSTEQVKIFDGLVSQQYNAIAVSPLDPTSINNSISKARKAGIKVATADADASASDRQVFVSQASDQDLGTTVMDQLAKATGSAGEYGIISGGADTATFNAWIKAARARQNSKYPEMKLVGGVRYTDGTSQAFQEAQNLMTAYPNLKGIIAVPSTAIPGVAQAVENAGSIGKVSVTGFGSPQTAGKYLNSGAMTSTVLWNVNDLGKLTVWALDQLAQGKDFQKSNIVPGLGKAVVYDKSTKTLLLGKPVVFTKESWSKYEF